MEKTVEQAKSDIRAGFFELMFGDRRGYLCIATTKPVAPKSSFSQYYFHWPDERDKVEEYILKVEQGHNVYFCVNLLEKQERKKEYALPTNVLWADLDEVNPAGLESLPPPIVVRTSPGRWQAYWRMSVNVPPFQAEEYSRRIAYSIQADKSGWDLTQLLRVPLTPNFKYELPTLVELERTLSTTAPPLIFESLPTGFETKIRPVPSENNSLSSENIIYKYASLLNKTAFYSLFTQEPALNDDWSSILWRFLHECFKVGMTVEEVFILAQDAKCNKYARDQRPIEHLWKDVLKAGELYDNVVPGEFELIRMPTLVETPHSTTFVDSYREWAMEATDAIPSFHDLCIFIALSAIISNSVRLETNAGMMVPNLWGLVLGDSTLTRKTTSMRLVMDFLLGMDNELIVATDGTAEGLLTGISNRPHKTSIFHKDEISGLFDAMSKKEYMAGMQETLTALYDVPTVYVRKLAKTTVVVESSAFIFLGGGVPERVFASVTEQFVLSGFLPRFLVVQGEADLDDRRPLGPPTEVGISKKPAIFNKLADLYEIYGSDVTVRLGGQKTTMPGRITAHLTADAWKLNAEFERALLKAAKESILKELALPTLDRLSRSLLKMAILLGAERQRPDGDNKITIEEGDVINAAWYVQQWGHNSVNLIVNAGRGTGEKLIDRVTQHIMNRPGVLKGDLMRRFHLTSREANELMQTLEERGMIRKEQRGRGYAYWSA